MRWLITALAILVLSVPAQAASIQARLIRASQSGQPTDPPLADIAVKLKKVFGYDHYYQLGREQVTLKPAKQQRVNLGEGFVIFVRLKGEAKDIVELDLEWYSGRAALCKQTVKLTRDQFLFIKGPDVGKDWIILALTALP